MKLSQRLLHYGCALAALCLLVTGELAGQSASSVANRVTQTPDGNVRVTLTGNVHPLARAENNRGAAADSLPMQRILLLLKRSDVQEAALQSLMEAQQDKSSPSFHKWLTPDEFGKQFGPSDADVQAVTDWLSAQGFANVRVAGGRNVIEFSGTAGQVRQAFSTTIQNYEMNGAMYVANASDPQIPVALAPVISGIVSLHDFPKKSHARYVGDAQMDAVSHKLTPLFTFPFASGTFYGVGPGDFATIYNTKPLIAGGNDGTGQTIAIAGETQINPQDVADFRTMFGLTNNFPASNIIRNGMDPGITSLEEESESDLDVQWSGAVAPGAMVKFVVSASTPASAGIDLSALYIVEQNLADVMSESYGECEQNLGSAGNAFYNALWEQAAAQGITVVVSSGDGGSAGCDDFNNQAPATHGLAVSGLAGTPFNVSLGGTDFNQFNLQSTFWKATNDSVTGTSAKGYIPEFPWNENCSQLGLTGCGATAPQGSVNIVAGSGGASSVYAKPKWQMGVTGVPNDSHRDQPDVSLFASPGFEGSGYLFCQADLTGVPSCNLNEAAYTFHIIGGTSASAPAFAGMMTLVNQYAAAHGGTSRQGNANMTLYALAKKSGASCTSSATEAAGCIFNDVAAGNVHYPAGAASNSVACKGGTANCSATVATTNGVLVDPAHTTTEAWTASAGYDRATGLGTLNANNLAAAWTSASTIATTTTLSLSPTTGITHGANENVSVTVSVKPNVGTGIAAGDVALLATLADGSTLGVDQFTLANGAVGAAKTQSLPGGTYKVYAHYTGDGTNAPSDSASVQVTVGKEASEVFIVIPTFDPQTGAQVSGNATSVQYGSPYIIRMYATNGTAVASTTGPPAPVCTSINEVTCPTGSVTLSANSTAIDGGIFTLNNEGYTRDIAPTLTGGTYPLVAKYGGDNSYNASTSATDTFTVTPAQSQTQVYVPSLNVIGTSVQVQAAVTLPVYGGITPTGTFTFRDGNSVLSGQVTISAFAGSSTNYPTINGYITTTLSSPGTNSITATYSGDSSYAGSTSPAADVLAQYPVTISLSVDSSTVLYGTPIKLTATVVANHTTPTLAGANLTFSVAGIVTTSLTTDSSGDQVLTATTTTTPQTGQAVYAYFSGSPYYADNSAAVIVNVNIPDFTLSVSPAPFNITAGQPGTLPISVIPATNNSSPVALSCSGNLPVGYSCAVTPSSVNLANGASSIAMLNLSPSASGAAAIQNAVTRKHNALFLVSGPNSLWPINFFGGSIVFLFFCWARKRKDLRASVGFGLIFMISLVIGCGGGSSSSSPPPPPPPSGPFATSTSLSIGSSKVAQNASVTLSAKVTGQGSPTGQVGFYANGGWIGTTLLSGGAASLNTTFPFPGIFSVTAQYSGDSNNLNSTSPGVSESVTGSTVMQLSGQTGSLVHSVNLIVTLQ
jgi:subtilase family serine protease